MFVNALTNVNLIVRVTKKTCLNKLKEKKIKHIVGPLWLFIFPNQILIILNGYSNECYPKMKF